MQSDEHLKNVVYLKGYDIWIKSSTPIGVRLFVKNNRNQVMTVSNSVTRKILYTEFQNP